MPKVRAMTITANNLLLRPKYGCDGGYDVAVKDLSVVEKALVWFWIIDET
jgi:hypothetical protein